jgi:hypothetical protein
MALLDHVDGSRRALTMVQAEPFNAEAPPDALTTDVTPTHLRYVRIASMLDGALRRP